MMKRIKISILTVLFILLIYNPGLNAYFEVAGIQSGIWSLDKSPYVVKNDILIPEGLVLKIEEGVVVKFAGNYQISVRGGLIAKGDKAKPIIFTSVFDNEFGKIILKENKIPQPSAWKGIEFLDDCDDYLTILSHCIVRYSKWGICCSNSYPILTNIMLVDNERRSLEINNQEYSFEPGQIINPISQETRPFISPLPEPVYEFDYEETLHLRQQQQRLEQEHLRALQDSIRKANKIKPIFSKTGRITVERDIIDQFQVHSINELMGYLPGFLNIAAIWIGDQITSRGIPPTLSNNRLLFQINGIPFHDPVANTSYLEFIPLDAIEQIEIDRGIIISQFNHHGIIGSANFLPRYSSSDFVNQSKIKLGVFGTKKITAFLGLNRDSTFINLSTNIMNNSGYCRTLSQGKIGSNFRQKFVSDLYNFSMFLNHHSWNIFTSYFEHDQFLLGLVPQLQYTGPTYRRGQVFSLRKEIKINHQLNTRITGLYVCSYERSEIANFTSTNSNELTAANYLISKGDFFSVAVLSQYKQPHYLVSAGITTSLIMVEPLLGIKNSDNGDMYNDIGGTSCKISHSENSGFVGIGYNLSPLIGFEGKTHVNFAESFKRPDFSADAKIIYNPFLPFDSYLRYSCTRRKATLVEKRIYLPHLFYGDTELKSEQFELWEWCTDIHLKRDLTCGFLIHRSKNSNVIQLNSDYHFTNNHKTLSTTGCEFVLQGKINKRFFLLTNVAYNRAKTSGWLYPRLKINGLARIQLLQNFSIIPAVQYLSQIKTNFKFGPYHLINLTLTYQLLPKIKISINGFDLLDQRPKNPEYIRGEISAIPAGPGKSLYFTMSIE